MIEGGEAMVCFSEYFIHGQEKSHGTSTHLSSDNPGCLAVLNVCILGSRSLPSLPISDTVHEKRDNDSASMWTYCGKEFINTYLCQRTCGFPLTFIPLNTVTSATMITIMR